MNAVLTLVVLAVAAWRVEGASPRVPADLQRLSFSPALFNSPALLTRRNDAQCNNRTLSCADCNRVNVCAYVGSGYTYLYYNTCPDSAPYCLEGKCVKQSDNCLLPAVANSFKCFEGDEFQGYYPAPHDCAKYYICSNGVPYVYNCPANHVYNHARAGCVRIDQSPDSCYIFPCRGTVQYLKYKPDESVYAVCTGGSTLVSKCPPNYRINPERPEEPCQPYCARQGRIADEDNSRAYYDCDLLKPTGQRTNCTNCASPGLLSDPVKQFCPPGMVYSAVEQRCVLTNEKARKA